MITALESLADGLNLTTLGSGSTTARWSTLPASVPIYDCSNEETSSSVTARYNQYRNQAILFRSAAAIVSDHGCHSGLSGVQSVNYLIYLWNTGPHYWKKLFLGSTFQNGKVFLQPADSRGWN